MKTNLRLKAVILQSGFKQFFIASKAGIDPTRFSKIVAGHVVPRRDEMESIAQALGSPVGKLFPRLTIRAAHSLGRHHECHHERGHQGAVLKAQGIVRGREKLNHDTKRR